MSRLLWFLIGSAATLVAGAVAGHVLNDDDPNVTGGQNDVPSMPEDQESPNAQEGDVQ